MHSMDLDTSATSPSMPRTGNAPSKVIARRLDNAGIDGGRILPWAVALFVLISCVSAPGQKPAQTLELNEKNYKTIRKTLTSSRDESGWRKISWRANLGEAIIEARKKNKPILLWMMNGHPCGMT